MYLFLYIKKRRRKRNVLSPSVFFYILIDAKKTRHAFIRASIFLTKKQMGVAAQERKKKAEEIVMII